MSNEELVQEVRDGRMTPEAALLAMQDNGPLEPNGSVAIKWMKEAWKASARWKSENGL